MGDHVYVLIQINPRYPDTRLMLCTNCGWWFEGDLEEADPPECIEW